MTEPLKLNASERGAAISALKENTGRAFEYQLQGVLRAINKVREGDPLGTIRHRPYSARYGVRVNRPDSQNRWQVMFADGSSCPESDDEVAEWPIIYTPKDGEF